MVEYKPKPMKPVPIGTKPMEGITITVIDGPSVSNEPVQIPFTVIDEPPHSDPYQIDVSRMDRLLDDLAALIIEISRRGTATRWNEDEQFRFEMRLFDLLRMYGGEQKDRSRDCEHCHANEIILSNTFAEHHRDVIPYELPVSKATGGPDATV